MDFDSPMKLARPAYVLLETVIATGLLIVGLAVIGAEIQDSDTAIRQMRLRLRAMTLAEQHLAEMDLGLIKLDSVDEVQDGDFGPRYPDFGWRLTTEPTAIEGLFRLTLDVMHHIRESPYKKDDFEVETAEKIFTAYAFRAAPQSVDLGADFGLKDEDVERVSQNASDACGRCLVGHAFNPACFATLDSEQLLQCLPVILDALGIPLGDLKSFIPPEVLEGLNNSGVLGQLGGAKKPEGEGE